MFVHKRLFSYVFLGLIIVNMFQLPIYGSTPYPDIFAESAILMDAKSGEVLYGKNENTRLYPASITKLLTALLAIENQKPTDTITLSQEAIYSVELGSSRIGLNIGEEISFDQGLHALLLASDNDVANAIAELCDGSISAFSEHLTRRAKELGANNTNFTNAHGLHDPNHYTTAYDMALIAKEVAKQPYFQEVMKDTTYQIPPTNKSSEIRYLSQQHSLMNEQRDSRMYRKDVIGGKTGFTNQAGNTLVTIAKRGDIELISVVLKSNRANQYSDTNALLDYGFENYKSISLHQTDNIVSVVPMYTIKSGQLIHMANCDISVEEDVSFLASSDVKKRKIDTIISLPPRIEKGIAIGDIVGTIAYNYEGQPLSINNLVITNFNHLPSIEPAVFPEKPEYIIPSFALPNGVPLTLMALVSVVTLGGTLSLYIRHQRHSRFEKNRKKILRFSRTIK